MFAAARQSKSGADLALPKIDGLTVLDRWRSCPISLFMSPSIMAGLLCMIVSPTAALVD
jgi:CheY-like chemotaxis protein